MSSKVDNRHSIAITGMAIMAPGGEDRTLDVDSFYDFLVNRRSATIRVPQDRWNAEAYHGTAPGKIITKSGCFLHNINRWDPQEFGITAKEASQVSHSQGLLLHVVHDALQDSGIDYRGKPVGVYVGAGAGSKGWEEDITACREYYTTGTFLSITANRLSYVFDLTGPSLPVDTACSASLTAMHLAVQAIRVGDCDTAVVAGVNLTVNPTDTAGFSMLGVLSPTGQSRAFDADANGYSRGDVVAAVILKRYDLALADNDRVRSVLLGSAVSTCGQLMGSLTTPSPIAQQTAIMQSYKDAGLRPCDADFVELHGTGTKVGDRTEANAAGEVFAKGRNGEPLFIGSVKSNVGHGELGAYMSSLIKCTLMLENGLILPNGYFKKPSPHIKWDEYNLRVATAPTKFVPRNGSFGVVSISSFGFGGAGGHTVIRQERPRPAGKSVLNEGPYLFLTGGLTPKATTTLAESYARDYGNYGQDSISEFMGQRGRQMPWRTFAVGSSVGSVTFSEPQMVQMKRQGPIAMLFSGQGPQHIAMGRDLFRRFRVFRESVLECDRYHAAYTGESLMAITGLFDGTTVPENSPTKLPIWPARVISSAITIFQMALFDLMAHLGFKPDVILGHSIGETAVQYASGAMSKEAVVQIAAARGRALELVDGIGGAMAALTCAPEMALEMMSMACVLNHAKGQLHLAAYNSPKNVGVSGPSEVIDHLVNIAKNWHRGIRAAKLRVSTAVHSPWMDPCEEQYRSDLAEIFAKHPAREPVTPVVSTVTGDYMREPLSADYLWSNMRQPVQFTDAVTRIVNDFPDATLLEFSPHPVLGSYAAEIGIERVFGLVARPRGNASEIHHFLINLGEITTAGINCLNFAQLNGAPTERLKLKAPTYPFQYNTKVHWADPVVGYYSRLLPPGKPLNAPLLRISPDLPGKWLGEHVIDKSTILPGSAFMEMALEYDGVTEIYDVEFAAAYALDDVNFTASTLKLARNGNTYEVRSSSELAKAASGIGAASVDELRWTRNSEANFEKMHSRGKLAFGKPDLTDIPQVIDVTGLMATFTDTAIGKDFYEENGEALQFGPLFRRLESLHWNPRNPTESLAFIRGFEELETEYRVHPVISDAMFQAAVAVFNIMTDSLAGSVMLPHSMKRAFRNDGSTEPLLPPGKVLPVYSKLTEWNPDYITVDIFLLSKTGEVIFSMVGCRLDRIRQRAENTEVMERYTIAWQPVAVDNPDAFTKSTELSVLPTDEKAPELLGFLDSLAITHIDRILKNEEVAMLEQPSALKAYLEACKRSSPTSWPLTKEEVERFQETFPALHDFAQAVADRQLQSLLKREFDEEAKHTHEQLAAFYGSSPFSSAAAEMLAIEVIKLIELVSKAGKKVIRILEVNSAGGALTEVLGRALVETSFEGCHIDYCCTDKDASNAGFAASRSAWKKISPMALDLDTDLRDQQVHPADIIIGVDCLLNDESVPSAVNKLKSLLLPGGSMVLMEASGTDRSTGSLWLRFAAARHGVPSTSLTATDNALWGQALEETGLAVSTIIDAETTSAAAPFITVAHLRKGSQSPPHLSNKFSVATPGTPESFDTDGSSNDGFDFVRADHDFSKVSALEEISVPATPPTEISTASSDRKFFCFQYGQEQSFVDFVNKLDNQAHCELWLHTSIADVNNSSLIGAVRTMRHEYPVWNIHVVEFVAPWDEERQKAFIWQNLMRLSHPEQEIRIKEDGEIEVSRLVAVEQPAKRQLLEGKPVAFNTEGDAWVHYPATMGDEDIEVRVHAINSAKGQELVEFAGVVTQRAPMAVFPVGVPVVGITERSPMASVITCNYGQVARIPHGYTFEQAAAMIGPLFKCSYALDTLSIVQRRALAKKAVIHISSSSTAWSLVLLNILKNQGWRIFLAVHGPTETFAKLADVAHRYDDPRRYAMAVQRWTEARGADFILAANDVAIDSSLLNASKECLNERFGVLAIEGEGEPISLTGSQRFFSLTPAADVKDVSFAVPNAVAEFKHLDQFESTAQPESMPLEKFVESKPENAVVQLTHLPNMEVFKPGAVSGSNFFNPRAAYVLIGGVGGLGIAMAQFIVRNGGRRVVITSRSGMKGFDGRLVRERWMLDNLRRLPGVQVDVVAVDATDIEGMRRMFASIDIPIAGVTYLAVRLADSLFSNLTQEMWEQVYDVKVHGLRVLQQAIDVSKLDWLVFCSSMATVFGSPGQTNYSGAQSIMERIAEDIPNCVAMTVPPIIDGGILIRSMPKEARNAALAKYTAFGMETSEVCQNILDAIRSIGMTSLHIPAMNWDEVTGNLLPPGSNEFLRHLLTYTGTTEITGVASGPTGIRTLAAAALSMDAEDLELNVPLASYGLDSLTSVRLSTSLKKELSLSVTQLQLLAGNCTINRLQEMLEESLAAEAAAAATVTSDSTSPTSSSVPNSGAREISEMEMAGTAVPLNTATSGTPLFIIHGAGGGVLVLQKTATRLPFPVYGIQDTREAPLNGTLEDLANFYLSKILEVQPRGPYRVGGFSFGSTIVTEITNTLLSRGEKVEAVLYLDGSPYVYYDRFFGDFVAHATRKLKMRDVVLTAVKDMCASGALDNAESIVNQFVQVFDENAEIPWVLRFVEAYFQHVHIGYEIGERWRTGKKGLGYENWDDVKVYLAKTTSAPAAETGFDTWKREQEYLFLETVGFKNFEARKFQTSHFGLLKEDSGLVEAIKRWLGDN